nr:AMP-binding protein [Agrobacterium sp. rho-8.1]
LFDRQTVEAIAARLERIFQAVVADPALPIGSLDILAADERRTMLVEWNETAHPVPDLTLPALLEEQVAKSPDAVALVFGETSLSYDELNARANRMAHHLIEAGVGPESIVGLCLERSIDMVVSLLAILKAGAAYLPLDPNYPEDRLAFMVEDAEPICILTTTGLADRLPPSQQILIDDHDLAQALAKRSPHNPTDQERT